MCMYKMKNFNKQPKLTKEQEASREQETIKALVQIVSKTDVGRSFSWLMSHAKKRTIFDR